MSQAQLPFDVERPEPWRVGERLHVHGEHRRVKWYHHGIAYGSSVTLEGPGRQLLTLYVADVLRAILPAGGGR